MSSGQKTLRIAGATLLALFVGAAHSPAADSQPEPYVPGPGDIMTAYIQPHHIKLWLAGEARNWPLADYEAKELGEAFEDLATYQGHWNNQPIDKLVEANMKPALAEIGKRIAGQDAAGFTRSYRALTAACNACHQATGNAPIMIKTPSGPDFPDQEFAPR